MDEEVNKEVPISDIELDDDIPDEEFSFLDD